MLLPPKIILSQNIVMDPTDKILTLAYINKHGQSNFTDAKQVQIEDFIR